MASGNGLNPALVSIIGLLCPWFTSIFNRAAISCWEESVSNFVSSSAGAQNPFDKPISVTITLYAMCATEFYVRYAADWPLRKAPNSVAPTNTMPGGEVLTKRTTLMTAGLVFSTTLLFIRQVLRKYFYVPC